MKHNCNNPGVKIISAPSPGHHGVKGSLSLGVQAGYGIQAGCGVQEGCGMQADLVVQAGYGMQAG